MPALQGIAGVDLALGLLAGGVEGERHVEGLTETSAIGLRVPTGCDVVGALMVEGVHRLFTNSDFPIFTHGLRCWRTSRNTGLRIRRRRVSRVPARALHDGIRQGLKAL